MAKARSLVMDWLHECLTRCGQVTKLTSRGEGGEVVNRPRPAENGRRHRYPHINRASPKLGGATLADEAIEAGVACT